MTAICRKRTRRRTIPAYLSWRLGNLDGLKVERIAIREKVESGNQIYIGTDDEHYGGILRLLPVLN
jgi:hypothetical protein